MVLTHRVMPGLIIYEVKRGSTCRKLSALLAERGIEYTASSTTPAVDGIDPRLQG